MTTDPAARPEDVPADLPPVDDVIHAAREASRHDLTATAEPAAPAHAAAATAAPAGTAVHGAPDAPAHDEHASGHGEALGPVDATQWAAGLIGVVVALAVAACFVLATAGLGAY